MLSEAEWFESKMREALWKLRESVCTLRAERVPTYYELESAKDSRSGWPQPEEGAAARPSVAFDREESANGVRRLLSKMVKEPMRDGVWEFYAESRDAQEVEYSFSAFVWFASESTAYLVPFDQRAGSDKPVRPAVFELMVPLRAVQTFALEGAEKSAPTLQTAAERAIQLIRSGDKRSLSAIAKELNIPRTTLRRSLVKAGVIIESKDEGETETPASSAAVNSSQSSELVPVETSPN